MRRRTDLPRVVSTREIIDRFGCTPDAVAHAIESGRWRRITRGVLLTCDQPPTRDDWVLTGMILTGPRAALSGWDAARLAGVGPPRPPTPHVLVLDRAGANRSRPGLHVRPTGRPYRATMLPASHPTLPFVPVVHPARAVADTALLYRTFDPVRAMVTSVIQRKGCRPEDLVAELERAPRQGSRLLRQALEDVADGARSIAEAEAVHLLTRAHVPAFEVNVPIVDRFGAVLAVADLLWRRLRAILEVDSREFHFAEEDWKATGRRHAMLTRHGFAVEHHPPSDIRSGGAAWAAGVGQGLRARAARLGLPHVAGQGAIPVPAGGHPPVLVP